MRAGTALVSRPCRPEVMAMVAMPGGDAPDKQARDDDTVRWWQAWQLAAEDGEDELRRRAAAGDHHAVEELAGWLADRDRNAEAIEMIRPLAAQGDDVAGLRLARWLADQDQDSELRRRAADGDHHALEELAGWLAGRGRLDELRELAAGHRRELAAWLARQHDVRLMHLAADLGDDGARRQLEGWRARLRERAAAGSEHARQALADWPG